jgi:hypothetical protein
MVRNRNLKTVFNYLPEILFAFYKMLPNEIAMINSKQIFIFPAGEH